MGENFKNSKKQYLKNGALIPPQFIFLHFRFRKPVQCDQNLSLAPKKQKGPRGPTDTFKVHK